MRKRLTMNALAMGNLKQRKKQYTIMIVGIILAMIFSSSTLFFMFSSYETEMAQQYKEKGYQNGILYTEENTEEVFRKAYEDGVVTDYGFAHVIGFGYTDDDGELMGTAIAWLDDNAKRLSNQLFIEGSYPEKENEIAIEENALLRLGIDARLGDKITLRVKTQNGSGYLDTVEKTYKLVGIAVDKKNNIQWNYQNNEMLPAAFVAQGTQTELGGKELLSAYVVGTDDYEEKIWIDADDWYYNNPFANIGLYLQNSSIEYDGVRIYVSNDFGYSSITSIVTGGEFYIVIAVVLIFASCMAIINSFNTNLKERKRQIGLLRAVGATKRQIIRVFGREALFISLICTPISIIISYTIVKIAISLLSEEAVFAKSIWALVVCAAVNVAVTMLAAFIPLIFTAWITPMQAIRNIDITRKMKTKKIKSQKQFNVSAHLAKRSAKLYAGGKIAVSVILSITIFFSCSGFSILNGIASETFFTDPSYDYRLSNMGNVYDGFVNGNLMNGVSEVEKRDIEAYPYFSKMITHKEVSSFFEVDEIDEYFLCFRYFSGIFDFDWYDESLRESNFELNNKDYQAYKNSLGAGKDIVNAPVYSYDAYAVKEIEKSLTAGKIDYDKLNSGEEIILVAPQTAKYVFLEGTYYDGDEIEPGANIVFEGELPYSVGDKIKLSVVEYMNEEDIERDRENGDYSGYSKRTDSEVTIAAIVHPNVLYDIDEIYIYEGFAFLTTHPGMNVLCEDARYLELEMSVDDSFEIDDELDEEITDFLQPFVEKYSGYLTSNYARNRDDINRTTGMYVAMLSIIILGFVICSSIVNNALTASIRERKKEIGTLRAVGADIGVLVKSYIWQLLSMFSYGYGLGFGAACIYFAGYNITMKMQDNGTVAISPWETIGFCVILFAICSFNLWSKVRKEMKYSIVENIKEL